MKKTFITGITGQDGSFLSELLLEKGYEVHGLVRRSSFFNRGRIEDIRQKTKSSGQFQLHYGDMTDSSSLNKLIAMIQPDEVYNLASQSHVAVSFATPEHDSGGWDGNPPHSERDQQYGTEKQNAFLPGLHQRTVRPSNGNPAKGNDSILSTQSLRCFQTVRPLNHYQLPRGV